MDKYKAVVNDTLKEEHPEIYEQCKGITYAFGKTPEQAVKRAVCEEEGGMIFFQLHERFLRTTLADEAEIEATRGNKWVKVLVIHNDYTEIHSVHYGINHFRSWFEREHGGLPDDKPFDADEIGEFLEWYLADRFQYEAFFIPVLTDKLERPVNTEDIFVKATNSIVEALVKTYSLKNDDDDQMLTSKSILRLRTIAGKDKVRLYSDA